MAHSAASADVMKKVKGKRKEKRSKLSDSDRDTLVGKYSILFAGLLFIVI